MGQKVQVEIAEIDQRGKLSLIPVLDEEEGGESEGSTGSEDETAK